MKLSCTRCGSIENITKDHIIPLAILRAMGMNGTEAENLQPFCLRCNRIKGSQLDPQNANTIPLLDMYIARWQALYTVPRKKNVYVYRNIPVKHDKTVYTFYISQPVEDLKEIYRKQRASWRKMSGVQ